MALEKIVERCQDLYEDLEFTSVRRWKEAGKNRKAIGHLPVYVQRELIHAAGMLPVGILGGGDQLDVIHGDAYYQSYICRIPRSTIELAVTGKLDCLDGMLFPSTCDVIRNLSGMWQLKFKNKLIRCASYNSSATNLLSWPDTRLRTTTCMRRSSCTTRIDAPSVICTRIDPRNPGRSRHRNCIC